MWEIQAGKSKNSLSLFHGMWGFSRDGSNDFTEVTCLRSKFSFIWFLHETNMGFPTAWWCHGTKRELSNVQVLTKFLFASDLLMIGQIKSHEPNPESTTGESSMQGVNSRTGSSGTVSGASYYTRQVGHKCRVRPADLGTCFCFLVSLYCLLQWTYSPKEEGD